MADITDMGEEEFFSYFIRVRGKRGAVLIFARGDVPGEDDPNELAKEIAELLDREGR